MKERLSYIISQVFCFLIWLLFSIAAILLLDHKEIISWGALIFFPFLVIRSFISLISSIFSPIEKLRKLKEKEQERKRLREEIRKYEQKSWEEHVIERTKKKVKKVHVPRIIDID